MLNNKIVKRIRDLNNLVNPFLIVFTYAALLIESFIYSGFLGKYLFLSAKSFLIISIASGLFGFLQSRKKVKPESLSTFYALVYTSNYLMAPVLILLYYLILTTEASNYPNYVFTKYHIIPENFSYLVYFNIFNLFLGANRIKRKKFIIPKLKFDQKPMLRHTMVLVIGVLFIFLGIDNLSRTIVRASKDFGYILSNRHFNYDQKMEIKWGFFYKYMKFVKKNTPDNSAVAIPPPVRPWLSTGNSVLVRYFLYPRFLITEENEFYDDREPDYYLLAKGLWKAYSEEDYGWPKVVMEGVTILYYESETDSTNSVVKDYDPSDSYNKNAWGLIKVN